MNEMEFIKAIQEYYGIKYRTGALKYIVGYLKKQPFLLEVVFEETIKEYSGQYKTLPDVSVFSKVVKAKKENVKDFMMDAPGQKLKFGYKPENLQIVDREL